MRFAWVHGCKTGRFEAHPASLHEHQQSQPTRGGWLANHACSGTEGRGVVVLLCEQVPRC